MAYGRRLYCWKEGQKRQQRLHCTVVVRLNSATHVNMNCGMLLLMKRVLNANKHARYLAKTMSSPSRAICYVQLLSLRPFGWLLQFFTHVHKVFLSPLSVNTFSVAFLLFQKRKRQLSSWHGQPFKGCGYQAVQERKWNNALTRTRT